MTSEIRANTLKNRVGLGTVSFTNTGPVVSGIVTATSIEVVGAVGDNAGRIKLPDGMTGSPYTGNLELGNSRDFVMVHDAHHTYITNNTGDLYIGNSAGNFPVYLKGNNAVEVRHASALVLQTTSSGVSFPRDIDVDGHTNLDNVSIAGVATATTFVGNLTGNVTGNISGGTVAGSTGTFSGDISITDKIVHTDDTNTAIRFPANDAFAVETAGGERLRITNTGATITGIINGPTQLNLQSTGGELINVTSTTAASRSTIKFNTNGNDWEIGARGSSADNPNNFYIFDNATTSYRMLIGSDGYVNIGTGTAQQQLTVQNSAQHSLIRVISNTSSDTGVDFGDTADGDIGRIRYSNNGDYMTFRVNNINSVRFDNSGRVQIGGGDTPAQVGDGRLIVYSTDRLHPAIKPAGMINNYANGWTLLGDNYQADESQINLGVSYSSSSLVLSRGVKVSGSADNTYLSSQDSYATRPCAIRMDELGAFNFLTTETNAATTVDSAVSLTEVFKIDRVGNIYQKISARNMYFGASNQLRIGVQSNGDPNIEAVSGDLKLMKNGSSIMQLRADGFEMKQDIYFGTAGKGIVLGNTSNVDANTLDDYEEGSWTPTARNDGSFTSAVGRYVKIGQQVTVWGFIPTVTNNTSNNVLQCSGLPFTATTSGMTEFVGSLMIRFLHLGSGVNGVSFCTYIASGRDFIEFFACRDDGNNYESVRHSDLSFTNSNGIRFCISYVA